MALDTNGEEDVVAEARRRGELAVQAVLAACGGLWSARTVGARLGLSTSTVRRWRREFRLLAIRLQDRRAFRYPAAQFSPPVNADGRVRVPPELRDVLSVAAGHLAPMELLAKLALPLPGLAEGLSAASSGFDALHAGDGAFVVTLVRHLTTRDDADAPLLAACDEAQW